MKMEEQLRDDMRKHGLLDPPHPQQRTSKTRTAPFQTKLMLSDEHLSMHDINIINNSNNNIIHLFLYDLRTL